MLASVHFSPKQLHGLSASDRHELLHSVGVNWNDCTVPEKRGIVICRAKQPRTIEWTHRKTGEHHSQEIVETIWKRDQAIPIFTQDRQYLRSLIPAMPSFEELACIDSGTMKLGEAS